MSNINDFTMEPTSSVWDAKDDKIIAYTGDKNAEVIKIPPFTREIGEKVFSGLNVKELYLCTPDMFLVIDSEAFKNCKNLTTVHFDTRHIAYCQDIFDNCPNLSKIIIENENYLETSNGCLLRPSFGFNTLIFVSRTIKGTITISSDCVCIDNKAFDQCSNITELILPDTLRFLHRLSLYGLSNLKVLHIGKDLKEIDHQIFKPLKSLETITISNENQNFKVKDNCLISFDEEKLYYVPSATKGTFRIPDYIKYVKQNAFYGLQISTLVIPYNFNLSNFEKGALGHLKNLKKIIFENKEVKVDYTMFEIPMKKKKPIYRVMRRIIQSFSPSQLSPTIKHQLQEDIIKALTNCTKEDTEWQNEWLLYIKKNMQTYYKEIISVSSFRKLLLDNKLFSLKNINELIQLSVDNNTPLITGELLEYQNNNFSDDKILKYKSKTLLKGFNF